LCRSLTSIFIQIGEQMWEVGRENNLRP
jgi:hypothetical protein